MVDHASQPVVNAPRNPVIDIAKGLGILFVVFGHNFMVHGEPVRIVFSFHMPLFFVLSGVFLSTRQGFGRFATARADSLFKPYIVVLIALSFAKALFQHASLRDQFLGVLYASGLTVEWVPMWFLPHLLLVSLVGWGVVSVLKEQLERPWFAALLIVALLVLGYSTLGAFWDRPWADFGLPQITLGQFTKVPGLPWTADLLPITLAFLLTGYACAARIKSFEPSAWWTSIAALTFVGLHAGFDEMLDLNQRQYGNFFVSTALIASGVYLTLVLATVLAKVDTLSRTLAYLGRASLFILIFHVIFQDKTMVFAHDRLHWSNGVTGMSGFIAGIVGSLAIYEAARRISVLARLLLPRPSTPRLRTASIA